MKLVRDLKVGDTCWEIEHSYATGKAPDPQKRVVVSVGRKYIYAGFKEGQDGKAYHVDTGIYKDWSSKRIIADLDAFMASQRADRAMGELHHQLMRGRAHEGVTLENIYAAAELLGVKLPEDL